MGRGGVLCLDLELNVTEIKNNINPVLKLKYESYVKGDGHNGMLVT